ALDGHAHAFKITTPADLERAKTIVSGKAQLAMRVGIGTDVHAYAEEGSARTLWLAGLEWPGERALEGHSDGDVAVHAIVDALLSAADLGDIGGLFGVDDPAVEGAHADVFLTRTRQVLADAGWVVGNVSVQIQARRPRFSVRRLEAQAALSELLGAPVTVSATTTDGLGFTGRGEGIAAMATALIVRASDRSAFP
ncbi:MAG TPA: 2-C-methyl-D-erythritol 2,4-cyclodiphosphate synthase, partial [Microbacteriaceae bacterium]|nr:2-C-methyl-D-erythritol 2,4-cyclodiphosphate synthase [Microbacteriaceae bacterium]